MKLTQKDELQGIVLEACPQAQQSIVLLPSMPVRATTVKYLQKLPSNN